MALVTANLVAEYVGRLAKAGTAPGNNADPTSVWDDLEGSYDSGSITTFGWTTSSGWAGSGTSGDPYRMVFDATNDDVPLTLGLNSTFATKTFSIETWSALPSNAGGSLGILGWCDSSYANAVDIRVTSHHLETHFVVASTDAIVNGTAAIDDGAMHHIVVTAGGGYWTAYVDGAGVGTPAAIGGGTLAAFIKGALGANAGWLTYCIHSTATLRLYSAALTSGDVAANYAAGVLAASTDSSAPTLTTTAISAIAADSATSGGSITSDGGATITARGVCWNTTGTPTIADSHTSD